MKANVFSKEHYYPMSLANGRDAVLIDYAGSNFVSINAHTHNVPYEGSPCGWYKMANLKKGEYQYPVIMAGIQVIQFGVPAEPTYYEQEFLPEKATLVTTLDFRHGLKLRITSFITKDSIWCERAEVLELPEDKEYGLAFRINEPFYAYGCYYGDFAYRSEVEFSQNGENELGVQYKIGNYTGKGALIANASFDKVVKKEEKKINDPKNIEGHFCKLHKGDILERTMICLNENETYITFEELYNKAKQGVNALETEHVREWQEYFAVSDISLPDSKLKAVYDVSKYILKSYQHPETGLIALGMLPNHWQGGVWCSWDAEFAHQALLSTGSFKESAYYTDSYVKTAPENYKIVEECGFPGVAFSGWTTVTGGFIGHTDPKEWLMEFKPSFCAYAIHAIYHEWQYNPKAINDQHKKIVEDILVFWLAKILVERDGLYHIIDVKDSAETGVSATLDSWLQSDIAKSFHYAYEMIGNEKYKEIGDKMLKALEANRRPDGVIADSTGSPYNSFLIWTYRYLSQENLVDPAVMENLFEELRTNWGYDTSIPLEEYRHWPWYNSGAAITYVVCKNPKKAMENIKNLPYGASSLGALPEKIRLDGFAVNHWYASPHAIYISALNAAFAHSVKENEILLLYGFTPDYGDFECRDIALIGGFSVSVKVQNGKVVFLEIKNNSSIEKQIILDVNPMFKITNQLKEIKIEGNGSFCFNK